MNRLLLCYACSTESNIPDYRGPKGAYTTGFKPMTHQQARRQFDMTVAIVLTYGLDSLAAQQRVLTRAHLSAYVT